MDRKFINDLPLNGRDVFDLVFLAPGVTEVDAACMGCSANNFISNGSRNATADILMDGVTTTNYEQNSGIRVETYTPGGCRRRIQGAGNEFQRRIWLQRRHRHQSGHALGHEQLSRKRVRISPPLQDGREQLVSTISREFPNPALRRNNFGGTIGGPIFKNKTFFFFDYQGIRLTRWPGRSFYGVPSDAERNGNFGEICADPMVGQRSMPRESVPIRTVNSGTRTPETMIRRWRRETLWHPSRSIISRPTPAR